MAQARKGTTPSLISGPVCLIASVFGHSELFQPALALSQMRRPHGGHRETYCCPDPAPFSTRPPRSRRMIRLFRSPLSGVSNHLPPWCALLAPKPAPHFQPRLQLLPRPHTNYNQTNPASPLFPPLPLPEAFLITPTPFNLHNCLPAKRLPSNSCIGRAPHDVPEPTCLLAMGRIRYSTSVSG